MRVSSTPRPETISTPDAVRPVTVLRGRPLRPSTPFQLPALTNNPLREVRYTRSASPLDGKRILRVPTPPVMITLSAVHAENHGHEAASGSSSSLSSEFLPAPRRIPPLVSCSSASLSNASPRASISAEWLNAHDIPLTFELEKQGRHHL
jgi:hypothetical protein